MPSYHESLECGNVYFSGKCRKWLIVLCDLLRLDSGSHCEVSNLSEGRVPFRFFRSHTGDGREIRARNSTPGVPLISHEKIPYRGPCRS
jgi:hypothetical protein